MNKCLCRSLQGRFSAEKPRMCRGCGGADRFGIIEYIAAVVEQVHSEERGSDAKSVVYQVRVTD